MLYQPSKPLYLLNDRVFDTVSDQGYITLAAFPDKVPSHWFPGLGKRFFAYISRKQHLNYSAPGSI